MCVEKDSLLRAEPFIIVHRYAYKAFGNVHVVCNKAGVAGGGVRRRIICESFSAIYEWWRISLCSTIVCCRGLRPKTTVC